jgi:trehalose/maltose hydrolase-like predicted phosphorylase
MNEQEAQLRSYPRLNIDLPLTPTSDPAWLLAEEDFTLAREHEIESIFAIGNGYVGTRASLDEGSPLSWPATFAAGVYVDDPASDLGPTLAVLPEWAHLEITVNGGRLSMVSGRILEHRRTLDLRQGVLWRDWRQEDRSGRVTRVRFLRLTSLADPHVLLQSVVVTAENYLGRVELVARLTAANDPGEGGASMFAGDPMLAIVRPREVTIAVAAGSIPQPKSEAVQSGHPGPTGRTGERWWWEIGLGETVRLDRPISLFTSRDVADPEKAACHHAAAIQQQGAEALVAAHVDAWRRRWDAAEVGIVGDEEAQQALRFAVYHLVAAAGRGDEHASIGARGLTGEGYRGHVFWDTEIYMLPFYVFTDPPAARSLLMYRYHTLGAARRKAQAHGYEGALYAWESAETGEETTPRTAVAPDGRVIRILTGEEEHHISADIAYAVWQYWRVTGDDEFMFDAGGEILIETARFWASRVRMEPDGRAHIRGVIGPDEYHEMVDDNAYTNVMAGWNLDRAAEAVTILQRDRPSDWTRLLARVRLSVDEPAAWRRIAAALVTGFDPDMGLLEQFDGYFELEEVDLAAHRNNQMPIEVWLGWERTRRSKAIKQADAVALCALLWDEWPLAVHEANFRYYEPRTAHGSSLSPAVHALVAARLGDGTLARSYLRQAGEIDLAKNTGHAASGVHMAALGGLWQATVFGMAGLQAREDGIALNPHLPPGWTELRCCVQWRGRRLRVKVNADPRRIEVEVDGAGDLTIAVSDGPACRGYPNRSYAVSHDGSAWAAWQAVDR